MNLNTSTADAQHLGDGVYVQCQTVSGQIVLTTDTHEIRWAGNVIYLEPEVVAALVNYINLRTLP